MLNDLIRVNNELNAEIKDLNVFLGRVVVESVALMKRVRAFQEMVIISWIIVSILTATILIRLLI